MTENTTQDATSTPQDDDTTQAGLEPDETTETAQTGNQEAARYRRRLREAEKERDQLAEQLDTARRHIVETIAGKSIDKPAALWVTGVTMPDLLDENGAVDPQKVADAVKTTKETLGLSAPFRGPIIPTQGKMPERRPERADWESAFSPNHG